MAHFTLAQVVKWLEAEVLTGEEGLERLVAMGHSADLMSDVLAFSRSDSLLLTGLANPQVIRTAEVSGIQGVLFVRGKRPAPEVVELAQEFGLPLMLSKLSMFDAVGLLFSHGLRGWSLLEQGDRA